MISGEFSYLNRVQEFRVQLSKIKNNQKISTRIRDLPQRKIARQFEYIFNSTAYNSDLSREGLIKNLYAIQFELSRFWKNNHEILRKLKIQTELGAKIKVLSKQFKVCKLEYEKDTNETFEQLLLREGVPNGLPDNFSYFDAYEYIRYEMIAPPAPWIPFLIKLELNCFDLSWKSFTALGELYALEDLYLNQLRDFVPSLSPLSNLKKLKKLHFRDCYIIDISPLSTLVELRCLEFEGSSQLKDISPLEKLAEIRSLLFFDTVVSDFSPLKDLPHFTFLAYADKQNPSLKSLSHIKNLTIS